MIVLREKMIYTIRDTYVMIDRDLAELYGVETKVLNQAVKDFPNHSDSGLQNRRHMNWSQIVTGS